MTANHKPWYRRVYFAVPLVAIIAFLPGTRVYHSYSNGALCASCHEISESRNKWHSSTHRNVACSSCHGSAFSTDVSFHLKNLHRVVTHLRGNFSEHIRLKPDDIEKMDARCKSCHQREYADWTAGPHRVTYREIFLDESHNRRRHLEDDCLRCHGMHFEGGIRDLVTPTDTKGPWKLHDANLAAQPAIPCIACHQMHRERDLVARTRVKDAAAKTVQVAIPSLGLFDRRELDYVAADQLPLPSMHEGGRLVKISPDQRQALCYQCHAPTAFMQVGSGDDRTPVGVHQGLSCFSCHQGHGQNARASCATCHPQFSNCGLNVETMDTTFKSSKSLHDIHSVKCVDCHISGVPKKKQTPTTAIARGD